MKKLITGLLFLVAVSLSYSSPVSYASIRQHLIQWEGWKDTPYRDGSGWSVGVGHYLTGHGEKPKFPPYRYSRSQIENYLNLDISWALDSCKAGVVNFDSLPQDVQLVAIGVAFTVGRTGFVRLRSFRTALSYRAYNAAAHELISLKWAKQVGSKRSREYFEILKKN